MKELASPFVVIAFLSAIFAVWKFSRDRFIDKKFNEAKNADDKKVIIITSMVVGFAQCMFYGFGVALALLVMSGTEYLYLAAAAVIGYVVSWCILVVQSAHRSSQA